MVPTWPLSNWVWFQADAAWFLLEPVSVVNHDNLNLTDHPLHTSSAQENQQHVEENQQHIEENQQHVAHKLFPYGILSSQT